MTRYNWQLLFAKQCGKIYTIICLSRNGFLLDCNHSLANSLLHYELKYLSWIGLWWWWFRVVWIILIFLMRTDWCRYNLVSNSFAGWGLLGSNPRVYTIEAPKHIAQKPTTSTFEPKPTNLKPNHTTPGQRLKLTGLVSPWSERGRQPDELAVHTAQRLPLVPDESQTRRSSLAARVWRPPTVSKP